MTDVFMMSQSTSPSTEFAPQFSKRYVLEIPDSNNQNYSSSQINFQMPSLATQDAFLSLPESTITLPYVISCKSTQPLTNTQFLAGLKAGFPNLVGGISLNIDNNQIINISELANIPLNYKIISQFSQDDVSNLADSLNFALDDTSSMSYTTAEGEQNNTFRSDVASNYLGDGALSESGKNLVNFGLRKRMDKTSYSATEAQKSKFTSDTHAKERRKSHVVVVSTTNTVYTVMVTLPLRFLTWDLFDKIPLTKGLYMRLSLNIHSGTTSFTMAANNGAISNVTYSTRFNCLPFMTTASAPNAGVGNVNASVITLTSGISIANGNENAFGLTSATFNAVMYRMTPSAEASYLSNFPSKRIDYTNIATNRHLNAPSNSGIQYLVNNSISKIRWLLVQCQLSASVNGSTNPYDGTLLGGNAPINPMESPFTSAPLTCMKECSLTNVQVRIGGVNHYDNPKVYSYDMFLNEIRSSGSLQGGLQNGLSSGLLDQAKWEEGYGYIFIDLSRKNDPSDDIIPKSIEFIAKNNTRCMMDLYFFVGYEQSFNLNTFTGKIEVV